MTLKLAPRIFKFFGNSIVILERPAIIMYFEAATIIFRSCISCRKNGFHSHKIRESHTGKNGSVNLYLKI